jgi:hypothetical protein
MNFINRPLIVACLRELSDRDLQKRVWTSIGPPEVGSFTECVEQLFTDSGLNDALNTGKTGFGKELETLLLGLEKQLAKVNPRQRPMQIINGPEMVGVRELASRGLRLMETL